MFCSWLGHYHLQQYSIFSQIFRLGHKLEEIERELVSLDVTWLTKL